MLYPLKFRPILKEKIWGGKKLNEILGKGKASSDFIGESWELSGVQGDLSVVANGFLEGNNIQELIEIYMGELVGEHVYEKFGDEFPLLIKFIDANQDLSIQVHPNDELAMERHDAYGKTEMWYIMHAEKGAKIISGFAKQISKEQFPEIIENGSLEQYLNYEDAREGDVFYIPAGRVHATGGGILLAEIQQTSDITYRLYDYKRKDKDGNERELHTELALDAIDFSIEKKYRTDYKAIPNLESRIVHCEHFNTNVLEFDKVLEKEYMFIDSFVIYICLEGSFIINYSDESVNVKMGETVLIPADLKVLKLEPQGKSKILEVYYK